MNYEELLERYLALIASHKILEEENEILKARLSASEHGKLTSCQDSTFNLPLELVIQKVPETDTHSGLIDYTDPSEKIRLFMSLFRGREDVYAKRWQNREGRFGYGRNMRTISRIQKQSKQTRAVSSCTSNRL